MSDNGAYVNRREFVKVSAIAGGGLLMGFRLGEASQQAPASFRPNAFVRIAPDGAITLTCHRNEMGQDVHTSLAMLLAEELGVDPRRVTVVRAPVDPAYNHAAIGA